MSALSAMLGETIWRNVTARPEASLLRDEGVVPILTRAVFEGTAGPFAQQVPMHTEGRHGLFHDVDDQGNVARLFLNMWLEAKAPLGSTWSPPGADAPRVLAGKLFAEHVFTRPFAPPGERKVLSLKGVGVPPARYHQPKVAELLDVPSEARALGEFTSQVTFSLMHTDSNQHVNSLVYPRLFEEAAANALGARGLSRFCDVRYRKPMFAGDRARIVLRPFEMNGELGVTGGFVVDGESAPRTTCRIVLATSGH